MSIVISTVKKEPTLSANISLSKDERIDVCDLPWFRSPRSPVSQARYVLPDSGLAQELAPARPIFSDS
jgi:hypothetical protein